MVPSQEDAFCQRMTVPCDWLDNNRVPVSPSRQASIALSSDASTSSVQRQRNRPDVIWSHRRQLYVSQTQQVKRHGVD